MSQYWTDIERTALEQARTLHDLIPVAMDIMGRMSPPICMLSGPLSTGGKGSLEENMRVFARAIHMLDEKGLAVFDQIPFQEALVRLTDHHNRTDYCHEMLDIFYWGVLESGRIRRIYFLPAWQTSIGASWEREMAIRLGIEVIDFPEEWAQELLTV